MKVLTDTHSIVWALSTPDSLSKKARNALTENDVIVSVASLWELLLKKDKGDALLSDPLFWWDKYVLASGIATLSIRNAHIIALGKLPDLHKDPFDRILVAQSISEGMPLVTKDKQLSRYGASTIW